MGLLAEEAKIFPSEIETAILAGIKAAEAEENETIKVEEHLFYTSKPDSFKGVSAFLQKYFNIAAVQDDSMVRYRAAESLVSIGKSEPEVITALLSLLQDDDPMMRYSSRSIGV